jgi:NhaP-type Na+/H+ or K+/H+ antiporter
MPRARGLADGVPAHAKSLYMLGVALATYGVAVAPPHGNGFIAVFVCAIVLGIRRPDLREDFERRADEVIELVKLGVFVVFGSLLSFDALFGDGWAAVGIVVFTLLVARPAAIWVALAGTGVDRPLKAFMAWFGPKGVATMTFSLLVLVQVGGTQGERLFNLAALAVLCSILAHGLTDSAGAAWIARRSEAG